MYHVSKDTIDMLVDGLVRELNKIPDSKRSGLMSQSDDKATSGLEWVSIFLKGYNSESMSALLGELLSINPLFLHDIRNHLFEFEDIALLPHTSLKKLINKLSPSDVLLASLWGGSGVLRSKAIKCLPKYEQETIEQDLNHHHPPGDKLIRKSQEIVMNTFWKLVDEGEIRLHEMV